jgi:hypothetical protein
MINDQEREAARLGLQALDRALMALGRRPVDQNPDFRLAEPVVGDLPNAVLEKRGAAPLRFVFGSDLDVWVGPFSEVVTLKVSEATKDLIQQRIEESCGHPSRVSLARGRWRSHSSFQVLSLGFAFRCEHRACHQPWSPSTRRTSRAGMCERTGDSTLTAGYR